MKIKMYAEKGIIFLSDHFRQPQTKFKPNCRIDQRRARTQNDIKKNNFAIVLLPLNLMKEKKSIFRLMVESAHLLFAKLC